MNIIFDNLQFCFFIYFIFFSMRKIIKLEKHVIIMVDAPVIIDFYSVTIFFPVSNHKKNKKNKLWLGRPNGYTEEGLYLFSIFLH